MDILDRINNINKSNSMNGMNGMYNVNGIKGTHNMRTRILSFQSPPIGLLQILLSTLRERTPDGVHRAALRSPPGRTPEPFSEQDAFPYLVASTKSSEMSKRLTFF